MPMASFQLLQTLLDRHLALLARWNSSYGKRMKFLSLAFGFFLQGHSCLFGVPLRLVWHQCTVCVLYCHPAAFEASYIPPMAFLGNIFAHVINPTRMHGNERGWESVPVGKKDYKQRCRSEPLNINMYPTHQWQTHL